MKVLSPNAKIDTSQMPKFGAGQYGAEISALMRKKCHSFILNVGWRFRSFYVSSKT